MDFSHKIKITVCLSTMNFFCYLSSMERKEAVQDDQSVAGIFEYGDETVVLVTEKTVAEQYVPSDLEKQIFGQRIRVENQSGIRLLLKIFCDGYNWKTILECNSSVDVGSLVEHPVKITYEPYGQVDGWLNIHYTCGGTIIPFDLIHMSGLGAISSEKCVFIRIKGVGLFGLSDVVSVGSCICQKNAFLQNLFPSVGYHVSAEYSYLSLFKDTMRYVLGLSKEFSVCDVNVASQRLLDEWDPELYKDRESQAVKKIREYIQWARDGLFNFPRELNKEEQQTYHKTSSEIIGLICQANGQNGKAKKK